MKLSTNLRTYGHNRISFALFKPAFTGGHNRFDPFSSVCFSLVLQALLVLPFGSVVKLLRFLASLVNKVRSHKMYKQRRCDDEISLDRIHQKFIS